ncbi:MAG TPA: FtsK/SpoIIIE domain-containing protein [Anaerohalosphaeraceae bacterium]|nr:FtsK/SpoIIIE domain-containing protein [Anaerohalosphaeraceae bacterium]
MDRNELIGRVIALYLRNRLTQEEASGTARYLLDCLEAEQTAAVGRAILSDESLYNLIEVKLPSHFVGHFNLPAEILTNERATYFRNASCSKSAILTANTGDDEEQSLKELIPINATTLQTYPELWVELSTKGITISEEHKDWWIIALKAILEIRALPLDGYAEYILKTREAVIEGNPILSALGIALPALRAPRDTNYFNSLNQKNVRHISKWKSLYAAVFKKRACYLLKQTPNQTVLSSEDLSDTFEKVKDSIPDSLHDIIQAFIKSNSGWNVTSSSIALCEWEHVKPLFDGLKRQSGNLGQMTLDFYDDREADLLSEDDRDYLNRLINRKTTEAQNEDEDFYRDHRQELKEQHSLKTKWDRFIFGSPIEHEDFLIGFALALEYLFDRELHVCKKKLNIRCDRRTKKDFKELNVDAGLYFAFRYRGLQELLGSRVTWDVGELFNFHKLYDAWRTTSRRTALNRSVAKSALQLKFYFELEVESQDGETDIISKQVIWLYNPNTISCEAFEDWSRLKEHPFINCKVNREPVNRKGRYQSIDIRDVITLVPTYGKDRGSFVPVYKKGIDLQLVWEANLHTSLQLNLITKDTHILLSDQFNLFRQSYNKAISGFTENGLSCKELIDQSVQYGHLLHDICLHAKGDRNREYLLKPLLQIGAITIEGGAVASIVAPWHPLRLTAIAYKARRVTSLVKHLLSNEEVLFGDSRLFFKELKAELEHPYYPEVILGWHHKKAELLSLTDYHLDYSLHELPIATDNGSDDTNENPSETASQVISLIRRYLELYPHEQANLTIVLYNCDAARLPQAIVEQISELHEDDEEMRCQVILRHRDNQKLADLYERIIESSETDTDSFIASEASRDFMARLRIGIMVDQAPVPNAKDGPLADIVFLQDVISRHSKLEWYYEPAKPIPSEKLVPSEWSRRRASASDDMRSVVYLCCPVQDESGWSFITAMTSFIKGDWDNNTNQRLLPARQLDFHDPSTGTIFRETHDLGNWVVNYDDLLDRRQLINQNVKVIRYKQSATQGRNMLISSIAPLGLLKSMVLKRLRDLNLNISDDQYRQLAEQFIDDANEISGDIVLRAAKRGRNASELIGIVLSKYLIKSELNQNRFFGWYFLDDYAEWLGQREQHIADILALSPSINDKGIMRLAVLVSEAKYIDASNISTKRKESQKQLRDTIRRIGDALFGDPKRLDRNLWLSRFSDLVLQGIYFSANTPLDLANWRRAIREGGCEIYLRGYSHVFLSSSNSSQGCSDFAEVSEVENSYQEVFSTDDVRKLVLAYFEKQSPMPIRQQIAGRDIWTGDFYRQPSETPPIIKMKEETNHEQDLTMKNENVEIKPTTEPSRDSLIPDWPYNGVADILKAHVPESISNDTERAWLKNTESMCKGALQQFQLQATLQASLLTPNAAILKFRGSSNLTVEQVLKRRSEFLTTHKLNIISVKAEPGVVAISIARPSRRVLHLLDVWQKWQPDCRNGNQELLVGLKEENGELLYLSPKVHAPHTLVAGSTGSGKSILMQNILLSIACTNRPDQARIVLIDPKLGVDYFAFSDLPHIDHGGIIESQDAAQEVLASLVNEMDRRYAILKQNRVANVFDLNKKSTATERLPVLWVIHDEFAEWMLTEHYRDNVSDIVARLGVKARAAGIFLVFAAQRPDVNVMPIQLRANLGNRLVLRVDSEGTSDIALGEKGAERLLGKGHLAAKLEGESAVITAQVPFISSEELETMVNQIVIS